MRNVIEINNLSKIYHLGEIGTGTISRDLERWFRMTIMGEDDPFLKIGETNERNKKGKGDIVYSLKDVNLEIKQGDSVGIIGKNGAGKSTLLKIISRVTNSSKGRVKIKGRVASLLEVGTGFHPELTGRENVFLNGAILGMRKDEIKHKFDEIVDFSGVERYIDTPVKRYSSGMYVRLAFAVAAHLESEILIVDEVLAVGDAEFQKKCLGKMGEVSMGDGRTILFVSHNMAAIQQLCRNGIFLTNGEVMFNGSAYEAVEQYLNLSGKAKMTTVDGYIDLKPVREKTHKDEVFNRIRIVDKNGIPKEIFPMLSFIRIEVELINTEKYPGMDYGLVLISSTGQRITSYATWMLRDKKETPSSIILEIPELKLAAGNYHIYLSMTHPKEGIYIDRIENAISFQVESIDVFNTGRNYDTDYGLVLPEGDFKLL